MLPIFSFIRHWMTSNYFTILLYHRPKPELFEKHAKFLKKNYNIIRLKNVYESLKLNNLDLPPHSLIITIDDGYKSNYSLLPVLRDYNINVTIFVLVGLFNTNRKIWNYVVNPLNKFENDRLKTLLNEDKNKYLMEKYCYYPRREYEKREMLNYSEIEQMKSHVDFQSHGMFHPLFTKCSEVELNFELNVSKELLEKITNDEVFAIAYPYGRFGSREIKAARYAGYNLGRIANLYCLNHINDNPMILKAINIEDKESIHDVERKLALAQIITILCSFLYRESSRNRNRLLKRIGYILLPGFQNFIENKNIRARTNFY